MNDLDFCFTRPMKPRDSERSNS